METTKVLEEFVDRVSGSYKGKRGENRLWKDIKVEEEHGFEVCLCGGTSFSRTCFHFGDEKISIGERCCKGKFYTALDERWELQKYGLKKGWVILGNSTFVPDDKWK